MTRTPALLLSSLLVLGLLAIPAAGRAQLNDTSWNEALTLSTNLVTDYYPGEDPAVPEPQAGSLSGTNYGADGNITFASGGPPNAYSYTNASYTSGISYLAVSAYCRIDFQFAVRQTSAPPVSVTAVPVNVTVSGTVGVSGGIFASANSQVNLASFQGPIQSWEVSVDNSSGTASDSFGETVQYQLAPDLVIDGDMTSDAGIAGEVLVMGTNATANAYVDPVIEIADETIPGSSDSYRDHYEIEFSPGYFALVPAPVEKTTWGRIKQLYTH